jgi:hypothetical protein
MLSPYHCEPIQYSRIREVPIARLKRFDVLGHGSSDLILPLIRLQILHLLHLPLEMMELSHD